MALETMNELFEIIDLNKAHQTYEGAKKLKQKSAN